jgi:hypothetical protein
VRSAVDLPPDGTRETLQECLAMMPTLTDRLLAGLIEPF